MQLVKRELGWVRVRDPATSREGWIHQEHITPSRESERDWS